MIRDQVSGIRHQQKRAHPEVLPIPDTRYLIPDNLISANARAILSHPAVHPVRPSTRRADAERRPHGIAESPRPGEALALRMRVRGVRGRADEVRRALLPRRHPVHPLRSRDRVSVSLAVVLPEIGYFGFIAMMVFLAILIV